MNEITVELELLVEEVVVGDEVYLDLPNYPSWYKVIDINFLHSFHYRFTFAAVGLLYWFSPPGQTLAIRRTEENETPL